MQLRGSKGGKERGRGRIESAKFQAWVDSYLYSSKSGVDKRRNCQELRNEVVKT
jgi:hypothetical protein